MTIPIQGITLNSLDGRTRQKATSTEYLGLDDIASFKRRIKWLKVARAIAINGVFSWFVDIEKEIECPRRIHDADIPNTDTLLSILVRKVKGGVREPEGMSSTFF